MRRILIAIGCDKYEHLRPLEAAEKDAMRVFETLLPPAVGDYDLNASVLLLSPTSADVRNVLEKALFEESVDTLTLFFAGHGAVKSGRFYFATTESRPEALTATAFSLGELFRMVAEVAPAQTYVIVDACEAGGLMEDLAALLKADTLGRSGTPGITLLATAAADQSALEDGFGGIGTSALLECVQGERYIQDSSPALDLVEIGRMVSTLVGQAGGQVPVVWGLNLYGPPSFCKNPYARTGDRPLRSVLVGWPDSDTLQVLQSSLPHLWGPYVAVTDCWEPRVFHEAISKVLASLGDRPLILTTLVDRICDAFVTRAAETTDKFRGIEVRGVCVAALLRQSNHADVEARMLRMCEDLADAVDEAVSDVVTAIMRDRFALLAEGAD